MKILLAYDNSTYAEEAKKRAILLVDKLGAELSIISVIPDFGYPLGEIQEGYYSTLYTTMSQNTEANLSKVVNELAKIGIKATPLLETGHPAEKILEAAETMRADLIILGSRGLHAVERFFLGSISSKVATYAKCDVLIVK